MVLDEDTRSDLQLFASDPTTPSLFKLCNHCRTDGGAKVLRRRMEAPWACAERIQATQTAICFIIANPDLFEALPPAYLVLNVERYGREILPVLQQQNSLEFFLGAFSLWAQEERFYSRISRGVRFSYRLLQSLQRFLTSLRRAEPSGDLAALVTEMSRLIDTVLVPSLPADGKRRWFWTTLRADQQFRLHERATLERLLQLIYEIDALVAMAKVSSQPGFCLPQIEAGTAGVSATALKHPLLSAAVGNPLDLAQAQRVLLLTGPNMAGKTTYLRAVATALYFAHLGMGVCAERFSFAPVQRLLTAISLSDDLLDGISYFRAEALRVKAVAQAIADGHSVIAIMDEPFKGTNVKDAFDASLAILLRLAQAQGCLFMVSSHLIELGESLGQTSGIVYRYFEAEEDGERLHFDYRLHDGLSSQRLGMRVLREEGIFELLGDE